MKSAFFVLALALVSVSLDARDVSQEDIPIHASVRFMGQHRCSGAVIGDSLVLTPAQCVQTAQTDYLEVAVGLQKEALHQVSHVTLHPLYDPFNKDFDLAVVKVESPFSIVNYDPNVNLANGVFNGTASNDPASTFEWNAENSQLSVKQADNMDDLNCATVPKTTCRLLCLRSQGLHGDIGAPLVSGGQLHGILVGKEDADQPGSAVGIYHRVYPYVDSFVADKRVVSDAVKGKVCSALRYLIEYIRSHPLIPSIIRTALEYLFKYMKC
ncbi:trypsin-7-like isoform X1 [Hetaerina americana]|uniref:trypsin-7-like isoform X1 n=1 Tax=Hetaerina americana TaxID=62018 RepID=UPI003A7F4497